MRLANTPEPANEKHSKHIYLHEWYKFEYTYHISGVPTIKDNINVLVLYDCDSLDKRVGFDYKPSSMQIWPTVHHRSVKIPWWILYFVVVGKLKTMQTSYIWPKERKLFKILTSLMVTVLLFAYMCSSHQSLHLSDLHHSSFNM